MSKYHRTIHHSFEAYFVAANGVTSEPFRTDWEYQQTRPYAVKVTFTHRLWPFGQPSIVTWEFALDLLLSISNPEALPEEVELGEGDVRLIRYRNGDYDLMLSPPAGEATIRLIGRWLKGFIDAAEEAYHEVLEDPHYLDNLLQASLDRLLHAP